MEHTSSGEDWESTVDGLTVTRSIDVTDSNVATVRLTFENDRADPVAVRLVETLPGAFSDVRSFKSPEADPEPWRRFGEWIIHEHAIPAGETREVGYRFDGPAAEVPDLDPPRLKTLDLSDDVDGVQDHERVPENPFDDDSAPAVPLIVANGGTPSTAVEERDEPDSPGPADEARSGDTDEVRSGVTDEARSGGTEEPRQSDMDDEPPADATDVPLEPPSEETDAASGSDDGGDTEAADGTEAGEGSEVAKPVVEEFIQALEEDASSDQRRALRRLLGASESERARIDYVRSRVDDMAAYIDALEELIDEHGIEVVDELKASIRSNATRTESLEDTVDTLETTTEEQHRELAGEVDELGDEVAALDDRFAARIDSLERELADTRSVLESLEETVEENRHVRARETRRLDGETAQIEEELETVQDRLRKAEAFRDRVTSALTAEAESGSDRHDSDSSSVSGSKVPSQ